MTRGTGGRHVFVRVRGPQPAVTEKLNTLTGVVEAHDGRVWVEEFPRQDGFRRWIAYSPDGEELGTLTLPAAYEVLEFGADVILLTEITGKGDQHLRRFGLR